MTTSMAKIYQQTFDSNTKLNMACKKLQAVIDKTSYRTAEYLDARWRELSRKSSVLSHAKMNF